MSSLPVAIAIPVDEGPWPRAVLHCDMDSFFVAVHRLHAPEDQGVPLVVGGSADGRGVVASASYEARRFGVRSAMPTARALRLCPGLKVVSANWSHIRACSKQVMEALAAFGPLEAMSVDEAYVDVTEALARFIADGRGPSAEEGPLAGAASRTKRPNEGGRPAAPTADRAGAMRGSRSSVPPRDDPAWIATAVAMGALPPRAVRSASLGRGAQKRPDRPPASSHMPTKRPESDARSRGEGPAPLPSPLARAFAASVREAVVAATGLPASVGLAPNKGVAKVASDFEKPEGVTVVPPGTEAAFLAPMPVRAIHGIGPRTAERLGRLGIETCAQLAAADPVQLAATFGQHAEGLSRRALGRDDRPVRPERGPAKSISAERTFRRDVSDQAALLAKVDELAEEIAGVLAKRKLEARTVIVKIRWDDFTTYTRQRTVEVPVSDAGELREIARLLWLEHWPPGKPVRLVGVGTAKLSDREEGQLKLWG
jgi:nucleotidyltransferase/DNA polymerase involved in DNA repair